MIIIILLVVSFCGFSEEFELMSYNVQNLFDTQKDYGKDDWAYLPMRTPGKKERCKQIFNRYYRRQCLEADWTLEKMNLKISQIARVVKGRKKVPAFLALQEIENERVLQRLTKKLGYSNWIISNSPDRRGIDVALLYNLSGDKKLIEVREERLVGKHFLRHPTRNILEVVFRFKKGFDLAIFINHWPSQGAPASVRVAAAKSLKMMIERRKKKNMRTAIIAVGDFNTTADDNLHPFKEILEKNDFLTRLRIKAGPTGTYFYKREKKWNTFDNIFVSNLPKRMKVSFLHIFSPSFLKKGAYPWSYNFRTIVEKNAGFSDHFPVYAKFSY